MAEKRDPGRTKAALLDAALVEFSTKGRAGARTSEIADRAGVNKQLISHHFGGKDGLYRALIQRWLDDDGSYGGPEVPLVDLIAAYVESGLSDRDLHRLLLRASLDEEQTDAGLNSDDLADIRRRQADGEVTDELDPAFVLLALQAVAALGIVFPGDVREVTGKDPASEDFMRWHRDQVRALVRVLGES